MEITTTSARCSCFQKIRDSKAKVLGTINRFIRRRLVVTHLSRTGGDGKEKYDVVAAPKKRKQSDEGNPPVKRQKKTVKVDSTTKAKSIRTLTPSLNKTVSESKQETNTKVTKPVDARAIITKITKGKSITASKACDYETKTKPDGIDLKYLIAKAKHIIHEKMLIDHRREYIARQMLA